jgi:Tol biopolymer transport system component/DNA-binding winged helix-turn-helix (wHTH) protein
MQGDFRVGDRLVSPTLNRLVRDGQEVRIEPKAMQVLVYLAGRPNELASRDELIAEVWRDTFVTDDVLKRCISDLRKALGDNRDHPQFIETIPKGGYRLIGTVSPISTTTEPRGPTAASNQARLYRTWRFAAIGTVVTGLVVGAAVWHRAQNSFPETARLLPVTTSPGWEEEPAISPDGTRVAFTRHSGNPSAPDGQLYVQTIGIEAPLKLTTEPDEVFSPTWSPDGAWLAFLRHADKDDSVHDIVIVPATGGEMRVVGQMHSIGHGLDWSPVDRVLAINDRESQNEPDGLYLLYLNDGQKLRLVGPPAGYDGDSWPRFSPDGRSLAFIRHSSSPAGDVHVVDVQSGRVTQITNDDTALSGVDWMPDGRHLVFSSGRQVGGRRLWTIPVSGGQPRRVDASGESAVHPSVARANRRLMVFGTLRTDITIWRVAGPAGDATAPTLRIDRSTSQDYHPQYSPDGRHIAFVSDRSGNQEVWISDPDGSNPRQVTFLDRTMTFGSSWSPDGRRLTFSTEVDGHFNLYTVRVTGGIPERLTRAEDDHLLPSFSRDGLSVYFHSKKSGTDQIWKTPVSGGRLVQVTRHGGVQALESWDGTYLYYTKQYFDRGPSGIWRMRLPDGEEEKVVDAAPTLGWNLFREGLVYLNVSNPALPTLCFLESTGGVTRQILPFLKPPSWTGVAVSADGRFVLHGYQDSAGTDIVALQNFR